MEIVALKNPSALDHEPVWSLFETILPENHGMIPGGAEAARNEIARDIESEQSAIFVAIERGSPVGITYISLPSVPPNPDPWWFGPHSTSKNPQVARQLLDAGVKYLSENGHDSFKTFNSTEKPDSIFGRCYRRITSDSKRLGSVIVFELKNGKAA